MSPGRKVGARNCSIQARKLSASIGPSKQAWRGQAVATQSGDEGERLASSLRHLGDQTLASGATAMHAGHVGLDPRLVDEDQSCRRDLALMGLPLPAPPGDIGTILLAGAQALFLKLSAA